MHYGQLCNVCDGIVVVSGGKVAAALVAYLAAGNLMATVPAELALVAQHAMALTEMKIDCLQC